MDATWVAERNRENLETYLSDVHKLADYIAEQKEAGVEFPHKEDDAREILIQDTIAAEDPSRIDYRALALACWGFLTFDFDEKIRPQLDARFGEGFCRGLDSMDPFNPHAADRYLDIVFELPAGDYVITDPCYIEHEWDYDAAKAGVSEPARFWEEEFSQAMPSMHMRDTLYGDWGCTVFRVPVEMTLDDMPADARRDSACGRFCADAGMVCVVSLAEAAAYNPGFAEKLESDVAGEPLDCRYATVIRNFAGECRFEVSESFYEYKGGWYTEYDVHVIMEGVDAATGEPVRYESRQTSL